MKVRDIRDQTYLTHDDVAGQNFIKTAGPFVFRRHFRQGLRSHVMELLRPAELELERTGTMVNGIRWFPKAKPYRIFRIFKTRLGTLDAALNEIGRVKLVEKYLAPSYMACSDEFVVDYDGPDGRSLLLCGMQAYIEGEILDPWRIIKGRQFRTDLYDRLIAHPAVALVSKQGWIRHFQKEAAIFIQRIKAMITETGHMPDLAGVGNLMVVPSGRIKLVDINNISPVHFDSTISLDDRGYPVCDKSIEALSHLEQKILDRAVDHNEALYRSFLNPERMAEVSRQEKHFYQKLNATRHQQS